MKKRFLALLIALLMTLQLCPITALAADTPITVSGTIPTQQNPLYPDRPLNAQRYTTDDTYSEDLAVTLSFQNDYYDIVAVMRDNLVQRNNNITISFTSRTVLQPDEFSDPFFDAMEHTGVPYEGDSLAFVWDTFGGTYDCSYYSNLYHYTMYYSIGYYTNAAQEAALTSKVNAVMNSLGFTSATTDYQKIKAIYDYITANVRYDYTHLDDINYLPMYTAYAALIDGTAVCQGYAVLFYRMCLEANVDARVISGLGNGGPHAWNIVGLDGTYYNIDSTWDEGQSTYWWFMRGSTDFPRHDADDTYSTEPFVSEYPIAATAYDPNSTHTHTPAVIPAVAPDCTQTGLSEGSYCSTCGETLVEQQIVPAKGHTEVTDAAVEPDCTNDGLTEGVHCSVCGAVIVEQEVVPATGHLKVYIAAVEPDCTNDGLTEGAVCLICDAVIVEQEVVPAMGHDFVYSATVPPTCTQQGYGLYICSRCSTEEKRDFTAVADHEYGDDGKCTVCGAEAPDNTDTLSGSWAGVAWLFVDGTLRIYVDKSQYVYSTTLPNVTSGDETPWAVRGFADLIEEIVVEDGVTVIGDANFENLPNLQSVTLPNSLTEIGMYAFAECPELQQIKLPEALEVIGSSAFQNCTSLEEIAVPEGVEEIPSFCFENCTALTKLTLPSTVKEIGAFFIKGCSSLKELHLPADVETIAYYAFYYSGLTDLYYPGSEARFKAVIGYEEDDPNDSLTPINPLPGITVHYGEVVTPSPDPEVSPSPDPEVSPSPDPEVSPSPEVPTSNPFVDVPEGEYYYDPVLWAVDNGITNGTSKNTFGPYDSCTRGQAVTFLWRSAGSPEPQNKVPLFTDVAEDSYCYEAVLWAVEQGITNGTSATTFGPNDPCTRAHVVTFLWRSRNSPTPDENRNPFFDVHANAYYRTAVVWAVENSITTGISAESFAPDTICNRSQIVTFLFRATTNH